MEAFNLSDVWRSRNRNKKTFTWSRGSKASRLDYHFVSDHYLGFVRECAVQSVAFSDHKIIWLSLGKAPEKRGPGFWKLNSELLSKTEVVEEVNALIDSKTEEYGDMNPIQKWELLKYDLRKLFISWNSKIKRERNEMIKELEEQISAISAKEDLIPEDLEVLHSLRRELFAIQKAKESKAYLRLKANWAMYGGKSSKLFLNLEKSRYTDKVITQLLSESGELITDQKEILETEKLFFQNLYKPRVQDAAMPDPYSHVETKTIDELEKGMLESQLCVQELEKAIKSMKNNKAPGSDGLSVEFYKAWPKISGLLIEYFNTSFKEGSLSAEQHSGVISLIPKKGKDKRVLGNWRPITLLNVDYKILAKAISTRLTTIIPNIVHNNQTGFVPGRFIGCNIRNLSDAISYFQGSEEGGLIASLDYAKAFDTLDRNFLFKALKSFNFGDKFISWVKLLYNGAQGCVVNNGFSSGWLSVDSGLRQGCPASPFFFILAAEKLSHAIRMNPNIRGLAIGDREYKISQYADDSTLVVADGRSLEVALGLISDFGVYSGLNLNMNKSQAMKINTDTQIFERGQQLSWRNSITILGLKFYNREGEERHAFEDFSDYIKKMTDICCKWAKRRIPLKGRVTVLNSLVLPIIYHAAQNSWCPENIIQKVNKVVTTFLWNGNSSKISYSTLSQPVHRGGLGLHNFKM